MADNLIHRLPPTFDSVEEERLHRKQRLAAAMRLFGLYGFEEGIAGHITARDPELTDHFWCNPFGLSYSHIRVSDLILVNRKGEVVEGRYPVNPSAFAIHSRIHAARSDIVSAAHSHAVHARALSAIEGETIEPITQDACAFYEDHGVYDTYLGPIFDPAEGDAIARALGSGKAVILRNHGLLTVGDSVDAAVYWFLSGERCAQVQLMAKAIGTVRHVPHEQAKLTQQLTGNGLTGWLNFQPLWDQITRLQPDLLD
ncbi:MAG: class II aldolase/adducin family protein [Frankia sp.]|nr:class II aldolase/adducin family protein [Frankia sp.]